MQQASVALESHILISYTLPQLKYRHAMPLVPTSAAVIGRKSHATLSGTEVAVSPNFPLKVINHISV